MEFWNVTDIKQNNIKSIVDVLRGQSGLTKKEISEITGLSFATVSNLCNELLERKIVEIVKKDTGSVGRIPSAISLSHNKFRVICLNLQMKGVLRLAVISIQNEVIFQEKYNIAELDSAEKVIAFAGKKFREDVLDDEEDSIYIGVGVAVSGIFDLPTETVVNCVVKIYEGVRLKEIVEQEFGLMCYVDNESNLCALNMKAQIKNCKDLIYLHFSEGVGVGIICNGSLLRGHHGYGGEVAMIPIGNPEKYYAEQGMYGSIENELSIPSIVKDYFGEDKIDTLQAWENFIKDLFEQKQAAVEAGKSIAKYLGELISMLIFILDPEYVYIGGELAQIYDILFEDFYGIVKDRYSRYGERHLKIIKDLHSDITINGGLNEKIYSKWML